MRLAYDELDSSNEPGVLPYSVEFGYLEPVDDALRCGKDVSEDEMKKIARHSPIPLEKLDEMYDNAKEKLVVLAGGTPLSIGLFATIKTSLSTMSTGVGCTCKGKKGDRARYCYGRTSCAHGC